MPRRMANGLTLLSAVVCVGSALLVGRSFWRVDQLWTVGRIQTSVATFDGLLGVTTHIQHEVNHVEVGGFRTLDSAGRGPNWDVMQQMTGIPWLGFGFRYARGLPVAMIEVILPLWLLPLLTAIAPVRWWRKRRWEAGRGFAVATDGCGV